MNVGNQGITGDEGERVTSGGSLLSWLGAGLAVLAVAALVIAGVCLWYFQKPPTVGPGPKVEPGTLLETKAVPVPKVRFTDVTQQAGIHFTHTNGAFGKRLLPETMGAGAAFVDYDNDGKPDLLFVNSCYWPGHEEKGPAPTLALYHNLGDGKFEDVTEAAGLALTMYGMGATIGDYDNDGWPDIFITGVGGNRLFHNEPAPGGGRRFREVTADAGVGGPGGWPKPGDGDFLSRKELLPFCTSASFLDYDGDGLLDLFVCSYVTWSPDYDLHANFNVAGEDRSFGPPTAFEGAQCFLYHNLGGGKFEDVSAKAGIQVFDKEGVDAADRKRSVAKSLGVIVADVDGDGYPDVIVSNDTVRNFFFHNVPAPGGGRMFEEIGYKSGVGYAEGRARGAMGVDWAWDYRPGLHAAAIGNFADEPDTFLCLDDAKRLRFSDHALAEGVGGPSRSLLKFGLLFFDYDNDGRADLLTCNGHVEPDIEKIRKSQKYKQPAQLFWNTGKQPGGFEPVTAEAAGPDLFKEMVGRGCAFADVDGDGALDLVLTGNGEAARLLHNGGGTGHHWVRLNLRGDGVHSNRSAIGARIVLEAGAVVQQREIAASRGYLSASELVVTFGLGAATKIDRVTIRWPGRDAGAPQVLMDVAVDKVNTVDQVYQKSAP
ncbi:MAG TPA: CRTAC1 family protein [Planctomycetales bacterium]|jgi:hypothetical protein|nr:CRTAC1 family protein [Planctomycetales bacterium]